MRKPVFVIAAVVVGAALLAGIYLFWLGPTKTIRIGLNIPLTGELSKMGVTTRNAAELYLDKIKEEGGLSIKGKKYQVEIVVRDNNSNPEKAKEAAAKLIKEDKVLAIVGPQASSQAVPAGEVANNLATPMISPWSTNPKTTKDRPYVFRACFLDPFQGPVLANFITEEFGFEAAAVLFDQNSAYPSGLAQYFKEAWEQLHGRGSVVAFEHFETDYSDLGAQINRIIQSGAQILFVPQYYSEVASIVNQAINMGWKGAIIGSDSWGSAETAKRCGSKCHGMFFCDHFVALGATGVSKDFVQDYKNKYGTLPDGGAALTWDCMALIRAALANVGKVSGRLDSDRKALRDALAKIEDFEGVTGEMTFSESGDPEKCAVIVRINDEGKYEYYKSVCPNYILFLSQ